jgi:tripartite-type tricarboxylate transporter receptor subunit TctC
MSGPRRVLIRIALGALATLAVLSSQATRAQSDYPSRPVRIIVPYAAGGSTDVFARLIGTKMGERLKQPFVVENKPGANGVIGAEFVARSPADGYTLISSGAVVYSPAFLRNAPFEFLRDFTPVSLWYSGGLYLFVSAALPVRTVKEFIDYAKANPGKVNYGSPAPNTMLGMEMFRRAAGIDLTHVPYKGAGPTTTALLAGEVQITLDSLASYKSLVDAGRLRVLAVTANERASVLPNVPTLAESGVTPLKAGFHGGLWAPTGTAQAIVERLNQVVIEVIRLPDVQEPIRAAGMIPESSTPGVFRQRIQAETEFWMTAAKVTGYRPD